MLEHGSLPGRGTLAVYLGVRCPTLKGQPPPIFADQAAGGVTPADAGMRGPPPVIPAKRSDERKSTNGPSRSAAQALDDVGAGRRVGESLEAAGAGDLLGHAHEAAPGRARQRAADADP